MVSPIVIEIAKAIAIKGSQELQRFGLREFRRFKKTQFERLVGPPEKRIAFERRVTGLGKFFGRTPGRIRRKRKRR